MDEPLSPTPDVGGMVTGTLPGAPFKPGSVNVRWQSTRKALVPSETGPEGGTFTGVQVVEHEANDDGAGNWIGFSGSINYTTGAFSLQVEQLYDYLEHEVQYDMIEV